ncbi:hypothetical protein [Roseixanthobacter glucoisosaccharinicivorans]|uniref:hypothetical protein n=1 Tax=Roseixanthobacter glucoisosaccharinicivorans TaxID=3119923 RepID=UPI00372837E1
MSERMTSIHLPGSRGSGGYAEYGRCEPAEMISVIRARAAHMKEEAERILSAPDDAFRVETYVGVHVQRRREILQEGKTEAHSHDQN